MIPSAGRAETPGSGGARAALHIVHSGVAGRIRVHVPGLYRDRQAAATFEERLRAHPSVRSAMAGVLTGNVLVIFDPACPVEKMLELLAQVDAAPARVPPVHPTQRVHDDGGQEAAGGSAAPPIAWYALSTEAVLGRLEAVVDGLSGDEARARLTRYGPNELRAARRRPLADIVLAQFKSAPVMLLIGSAVLSVGTGGLLDAAVIVGVIAINATIGAYTEAAAERTISALTRFTAPPARHATQRAARAGRDLGAGAG